MNNLENKLKQLIDARINALSKRVEDRIIYIDNKASSGIIDTEEKTEQNNTQIKEMEEQIAQNEESIEDLSKLIEENATNIAENEENISLNKVSIAELKQIIGNIQNSKYYNVIIDSDGGNINDDYVKMQGAKVSHPGTPSKDGYRFIDWFIGDNECYFPIPIEDKTIIVAKWNKIIYYTVVYEENGGTELEDDIVEKGTIIEEPNILKNGHYFRGWYSDAEFNNVILFPYQVESDITMYAKWEEIIYYTITFNSNGGTEIESITAEANTEISLPRPTKENNLFTGWFLDPECTTPAVNPIVLTSDIVLYAGWESEISTVYASDLNTRFVRFRCSKTTDDWAFNFSEIEVFVNNVNVALGKKARKSASDGTFVDTVATNGVYNHYRSGNNIVGCDGVPKNNWFTIDLEQGYNIDTVKFFGMDMIHAVNTIEGLELQISEDDNNWYFIEKSDITLNKVTDDTQHTPKVYDLTSVVIINPNKQYLSDIPVRYIKSKIGSESRGYSYSVLEVEAYSNGVNVALGKPAKMRNEAYQSSNLATDGNFNSTEYFTLSPYQWMTIDLQSLYKLDNLHYYSFDTYGDNGSSFYWNDHEVLVSPDGETWYVVGKSNEIHVNKTAGWTRDYINYNLTTTEVVEKTELPLSILNIKYIRDEQWGNTLADYYANWSEIMAMKDGVNVAQGCPILQSWDSRTYNDSIITDGILDGQYISHKTGGRDNPGYIMITLNEPVNLDSVIIVRGHANQNIGYYNRVLVSEDKVTWYVLYDSIEEGVYTETVDGREFTTYK